MRVHRLVGETWLDAKDDDCVLHRDETLPEPFIHSVENLWLGDRTDNSKDRDTKGRLKGKKKNLIPEHTRKKVWALRKLGLIVREIGDILDLNYYSVNNVLTRDKDTNIYFEERIV